MKIAVSAMGKTLDSETDPRFGRAQSFIFVETDTMAYEAIDNGGEAASGGAGISAAQLIANKNVKALITGSVGPNAMNVLKAAAIEIYKGGRASVSENVALFMEGALEKISDTVPPHHGMGAR
jgi:predicted Fe-Mo cluster-binding NifX family protein